MHNKSKLYLQVILIVSTAVQKKTYTTITNCRTRRAEQVLTAANVRILCMKHNLNKSNKILTIPPYFLANKTTPLLFLPIDRDRLSSREEFKGVCKLNIRNIAKTDHFNGIGFYP